jgi:hypothetical protein
MMKYVFILFLFSCSKDKPITYTKDELFDLCRATDPACTVVLPRSMSEGVKCEDYSEGCLAAHKVKARDLEFIGVEFSNTEQAIRAAKRYHGYYIRNWLIDDVYGEPILERFVKEAFKAIKFDEPVPDESGKDS